MIIHIVASNALARSYGCKNQQRKRMNLRSTAWAIGQVSALHGALL
jgi:hypothetical protein